MAGRLSVLFVGLTLPLVFSIRLEDGFELPQILCAFLSASFLLLAIKASEWVEVLRENALIFLLTLGLLGCSLYSFLGLTQNVFFYFPTQNYLWVLMPVLFLLPIGLFLEKRKFYYALVVSGFLGSLYALAQALGLDLGGWDTHFGGRSFSTLGNPIFWAGHLLVLIPLALYLALSAKGRTEKFFWLGVLVVFVASLLATQTRGAWLGVLGEAALLVAFTWRRSQVWKGLMLGIIAFLLTILLVPSLSQRAVSLFHPHSQDAQGRYFLWKAALKLWEEKPLLGQGPGGYANHFHRIQAELTQQDPGRPFWTAFHAHEEYLEFLAERGLVGFGLGTAILLLLFQRRIKIQNAGQLLSADSVEIVIMGGIGIQSLFNFPLSVVPTACALALLFNPSWDQTTIPAMKKQGIGSELKFLLGAALVLVIGFGMKVMAQDNRLHQATDLNNGQHFAEALHALDFDPSIGFYHYTDPRVLKQKAAALEGLGKLSEACGVMEQAIRLYPFDADADAVLCMLYGKQKNWSKAESYGQKALELSPCHEQALNNLAVASYLQGRKKEAVQYLSRLEQAETYWGQKEKAGEIHQKIAALESTHR